MGKTSERTEFKKDDGNLLLIIFKIIRDRDVGADLRCDFCFVVLVSSDID